MAGTGVASSSALLIAALKFCASDASLDEETDISLAGETSARSWGAAVIPVNISPATSAAGLASHQPSLSLRPIPKFLRCCRSFGQFALGSYRRIGADRRGSGPIGATGPAAQL